MSGRRFRETEEEEKRRGTIGPEVGGGARRRRPCRFPTAGGDRDDAEGPRGRARGSTGGRARGRGGCGIGAWLRRRPRRAGRWHSRACTMIDLMDE